MMNRYRDMLAIELAKNSSNAGYLPTVFTAKSTKDSKDSTGGKGISDFSSDGMDNCWLDDQGRLRIRGLAPKHITRLELLVCLGADIEEIENHIHPLETHEQWRQWVSVSKQNQEDDDAVSIPR